MAPTTQNSSPVSLLTLRRQASAVGAACGNAARADLCGGRWATGVPTATGLKNRPKDYRRAVVVNAKKNEQEEKRKRKTLLGEKKEVSLKIV